MPPMVAATAKAASAPDANSANLIMVVSPDQRRRSVWMGFIV
jgi:hypothetical protein